MKKLSKRIISLVLALVMAMPVMLILPTTASAATYDTSSLQNKILEWNFVGSSKPAISSPVPDVNDSYNQSVPATYGNVTLNLHNWSTGDRHFHYDNDNDGIKSTDGIAYINNLKNYLVDGKDIDIRFTMAVNGNQTSNGKGIFSIGSAYVDSGSNSTANDLVYWRNDGDMRYKSTSSNTDIRIGTAESARPNQYTYYDYRIYFDYSVKRIYIYRNNELKGSVQDNAINKNSFGVLVIGAHVSNNFGNNAIKSISVSQPDVKDAGTIETSTVGSGITKQSVSQTTGIVHSGNTSAGAVKENVLYPNAAGAPDSNQYENNLSNDSNTQMKTKVMFPALRMVFLYDGTANNIKIPVIANSVMRGGAGYVLKKYAVNFISVDGSNWALKSDWYKCSGWNNWNQTVSGSVNDFTIVSYQNTHNHTDYNGDNRDGSGGNSENYYSNYVYYNQSISDSTYYKDLTCPTFTIAYDGWANWWSFGQKYGYYNYPSGSSDYPNTIRTGMVPCNGKGTVEIKALNYVPLANVITTINGTDFQNLLTDVNTNGWKYTEDSKKKFYAVISRVKNFNLTAYDYSSNIALAAAADEMKSIVNAFNTYGTPSLNNFTITYVDKNGSSSTATVLAGNTLANKTSGAAVPSLPAAEYVSNNKHNTYSYSSSNVWDNTKTPSGTHIPHSNETYTVNTTLVNCTGAQGTAVAATSEHNGYTPYECSVCHHETSRTYNALNWTAYNNALSDYNTKTTNGVYTTSTVATCVSDASAYIGYNNTSNTGANTPQSTINTATSAINTAVGKLKEKASFDALDTAYTTAQNSFAALNASDYTTSTYALVNTYLSTAGNFPYHSMDAATRANTAAETYQTAINSEKDALAAALTGLELRADFSALDTAKNDAIDELDSLASANTTSSVATARAYLTDASEFPYEYSADRNDTGVSKNSEIATEATKFGNWKTDSPLEAKASFTALDTAKNDAIAELDGLASGYTTSSVATARTYLTSSAQFPYEYSADRADTGVSQNSAISAEATKFGSWKTAVTLDPRADLTKIETAYEEGDALLNSLVGKTAQYDAASVQALIDAVDDANASEYIGATSEEKADFGTVGENSDQDKADDLADDINDAIEGLKIAEIIDEETGEPVDTSVFDELVEVINNLDPDAYEENEGGSLAGAKSTINEVYGAGTKVYEGQNINVITGITSQDDADAAADAIQSALTVCTKKYVITRNSGVSEFGITNGTEEGGKVNYGATLTCRSGDDETAWFIEVQTGSMHKKYTFQSYGKTLKTKVLGTTTVNAIKRDSTNNCRIMITRNYGDDREPIQYATFVPSGTEFELPAAPAIAYTTFNGYSYKNGDAIGTATITVTGDVDIVANYTEAAADCAINATDINSVEHNSTVSYNAKVELDGGDGAYGWVEQVGTTYRPFYKGQKVSFLATESTTLMAVNQAAFESYGTAPIINLRKGGVIVSESKYMFNAQIVPGNADIREYGILVAAPSSKNGATPIIPANSQIVIENSGQHEGYAILRAKSTKLVGANQFTIAVNNLPSGYKYRGYIIYHDGKALKTVYSDIM